MPERPKGAVCKIAGVAYGGSNPPPPTTVMSRDIVPICLGKQVDVTVLSTVRALFEGKWQGGVRIFGLAENGVDYVYDEPARGMIPNEVRAPVESLRQDIIAGKIVVPSTR